MANGTALTAAAVALFVAGVLLGFSALASLARARLLRFLARSLLSVLFVGLGIGLGIVVLGTQGMHALTHEETAARIKVVPTGPQRYDATVTFPEAGSRPTPSPATTSTSTRTSSSGRRSPTSSACTRPTGSTASAAATATFAQETTAPRTIHSLGVPGGLDIVGMARRFPLAKAIFDAQYGSATYVPVDGPAELELRVSTSGLLLRQPQPAPG